MEPVEHADWLDAHFLEQRGTVATIGSYTVLAQQLGLPLCTDCR